MVEDRPVAFKFRHAPRRHCRSVGAVVPPRPPWLVRWGELGQGLTRSTDWPFGPTIPAGSLNWGHLRWKAIGRGRRWLSSFRFPLCGPLLSFLAMTNMQTFAPPMLENPQISVLLPASGLSVAEECKNHSENISGAIPIIGSSTRCFSIPSSKPTISRPRSQF